MAAATATVDANADVKTKLLDKTRAAAVAAKPKAKTDWTVALAFRNITATDSWSLWSATKMTCGSVAHVELLFKVQCSGGKSCPYNSSDAKTGQFYVDESNHTKGSFHVLAFAVRNTAESNVVECAVDPNFHKYCGWSFIGLNLPAANTVKALRFCIGQLGCGYNEVGYQWNAFTGWFGKATGATYEDIKESVKVKRRPWFCSELVAAALMRCYAIDYKEIGREPCTTTPHTIWQYYVETNKDSHMWFPLNEESVW